MTSKKIIQICLLTILVTMPIYGSNLEEQTVSKVVTNYHTKIKELSKMVKEDSSIEPIYIYFRGGEQLFTDSSAVMTGKLPDRIQKLVKSILSDFGGKVHVIDSIHMPEEIKNNPRLLNIRGAITGFDEIKSSSSTLGLYLENNSDEDKAKLEDRFKNSKATSRLVTDFWLVNPEGLIVNKTSSSIMIRGENKGFRVGLKLFGVNLSYSEFERIEDGIDASIRKVVEASMIDLIGRAFGIETYQIIPEVQRELHPEKSTHLSNFDFCSDINKIVFYTEAIRDKNYNKYGLSFESEMNKFKCLKKLFEKHNQSVTSKIKLNARISKNMSNEEVINNTMLIQTILRSYSIPRSKIDTLITKNNNICEHSDEYCRLLENRIEAKEVLYYK